MRRKDLQAKLRAKFEQVRPKSTMNDRAAPARKAARLVMGGNGSGGEGDVADGATSAHHAVANIGEEGCKAIDKGLKAPKMNITDEQAKSDAAKLRRGIFPCGEVDFVRNYEAALEAEEADDEEEVEGDGDEQFPVVRPVARVGTGSPRTRYRTPKPDPRRRRVACGMTCDEVFGDFRAHALWCFFYKMGGV